MCILLTHHQKHALSNRLALLVIGLALITGCGFKLRESVEMPPVLSRISVVGGNRMFNEQLVQRLQQSGSVVVEADSAATLFISRSEYQKSVRTLDAAGLATGYDYTYTVDYQVSDSNGVVLRPRSIISQQRTLEYDATQVLQIEQEEAFLKKQIEQEIISQLLRQLSQIEQVR